MTVTNQKIAEILWDISRCLSEQQANPYRIGAYRRAASTVEALDEPVASLFKRDGITGLQALPTIGKRLASIIAEILHTGHCEMLERVSGSVDAGKLFQRVAGIGPVLAQQIHAQLHIDTLPELEMAAHDGRLAAVSGIGPRRLVAIKKGLAGALGRPFRSEHQRRSMPSVAQLLHVDDLYRHLAKTGELPTIAPRRFNPDHESWLPVLHTEYEGWHITALFSNTARAHELKRTDDWVVIYFDDDAHDDGQVTVVTEGQGVLKGRRVVRGLEQACIAHYDELSQVPESSRIG